MQIREISVESFETANSEIALSTSAHIWGAPDPIRTLTMLIHEVENLCFQSTHVTRSENVKTAGVFMIMILSV